MKMTIETVDPMLTRISLDGRLTSKELENDEKFAFATWTKKLQLAVDLSAARSRRSAADPF
jgi:hypothetical protein